MGNKCFIIDDDPFTANYIKKIISNAGYTDATIYYSGVDAINELHHNPEIVFLDIQMESLNGFEVLKKIKRYNPDAFVIMVSSQEDMRLALDTLRYGALEYIIKNDQIDAEIVKILHKIESIKQHLEEKNTSIFKKLFK